LEIRHRNPLVQQSLPRHTAQYNSETQAADGSGFHKHAIPPPK
jgi:hypothetical protein